jgi:hypothetical protein
VLLPPLEPSTHHTLHYMTLDRTIGPLSYDGMCRVFIFTSVLPQQKQKVAQPVVHNCSNSLLGNVCLGVVQTCTFSCGARALSVVVQVSTFSCASNQKVL